MAEANKCEHKKPNGQRCRANALTNDRFCFSHSPAKTRERQQARSAGGISRSQKMFPPGTEERRLQNPTEVCDLLSATINQVRCGLIDSRIATTVGYLAGTLLRGMEHGQLDDRLTTIEAKLGIIDSTRREIIPNATAKSNGPN